MIGVVDYGVGNVHSVVKAFRWLGWEAELFSEPERLTGADRLVLPGVGAFGFGMDNLRTRGLEEALRELVLRRGRPFLGICLGMQLLFAGSEESPGVPGLGWFPQQVQHLGRICGNRTLPHVGWNDLTLRWTPPPFSSLPAKASDVYFVHSYGILETEIPEVCALCCYGGVFAASVCRENLLGVQFHPEKSQDNGMELLDLFATWRP